MDVYQKWMDYVEGTKKVAEEKRLAHYYGDSNKATKKIKKDVLNLKNELRLRYKQLARMNENSKNNT